MTLVSYNIKVDGKVQGVFFRATTKAKAISLGIKGWVRNESNGSVQIEAEGREAQMKQFIEWCHHGPDEAVVNGVSITPIALHKHTSFEIVR